ncbi:Rap1a/Tai family immunity protein [Tritonibacter mobilis]|nr:Rap1a/Tai family immunity protein [Tritonibacter mobilis]
MKVARCLMCVAFLFSGTLVSAGSISGNDLLEGCEADNPIGVERGFCLGFIMGAVDGLKWGALRGIQLVKPDEFDSESYNAITDLALQTCPPDGVENGQIVDIVVQYLAANPQARHNSARALIQLALSESFPCF